MFKNVFHIIRADFGRNFVENMDLNEILLRPIHTALTDADQLRDLSVLHVQI